MQTKPILGCLARVFLILAVASQLLIPSVSAFADADDGALDDAAASSAQDLSAAVSEFLAQPSSPFPSQTAP